MTLIGTTLGAYRLEALLGSGGMAQVYRATDQRLRRQVAVKVLAPGAAQVPGFADRFLQEARLIASLRHPNIVQIYDFGEQDGLTYMVQELLAGPTLAQQLRDLAARGQRFGREQALAVAGQLAAALDAAHAAGIIHRDVKPSNAIWSERGALVLTDFGIAKNTQLATDYTQTGMVIGTPDYLSPEQASNRPLTPGSDIYSLGVLLYELLTGAPPFRGDTALAVALSHMQDAPPPLRASRPDLPLAAERVVDRALAKDPAQRFSSAGAFAAALARAWPAGGAPLAEPAHANTTRLVSQPAAAPAARPQPSRAWQPAAAVREPIAAAPRGPREWLPLPALLIGLALLLGAALLSLPNAPATQQPGAPTARLPAPTEPVVAPEQPTPAEPPTETPTEAPAEAPTEVPTEAPALTEVPAPTEAPTETPVPTEAPAPTEPPTESPNEDATIAQLRELLLAGQEHGRAGKHARDLVRSLDRAVRALAEGDAKDATNQLRDMQKRVADDLKDEAIDPKFADQVLAGIAAVAERYDLRLPPKG